MALTICESLMSLSSFLLISKPPYAPFTELITLCLTKACKILAVNACGELISLAISFGLTRLPLYEFIAMKIVALIPYSQAFENILFTLLETNIRYFF